LIGNGRTPASGAGEQERDLSLPEFVPRGPGLPQPRPGAGRARRGERILLPHAGVSLLRPDPARGSRRLCIATPLPAYFRYICVYPAGADFFIIAGDDPTPDLSPRTSAGPTSSTTPMTAGRGVALAGHRRRTSGPAPPAGRGPDGRRRRRRRGPHGAGPPRPGRLRPRQLTRAAAVGLTPRRRRGYTVRSPFPDEDDTRQSKPRPRARARCSWRVSSSSGKGLRTVYPRRRRGVKPTAAARVSCRAAAGQDAVARAVWAATPAASPAVRASSSRRSRPEVRRRWPARATPRPAGHRVVELVGPADVRRAEIRRGVIAGDDEEVRAGGIDADVAEIGGKRRRDAEAPGAAGRDRDEVEILRHEEVISVRPAARVLHLDAVG